MFKEKTVFVIGAGASKDLKIPLGLELRNDISAFLRKLELDDFGQVKGPPVLLKAIRERIMPVTGTDYFRVHHAAHHIARNIPFARSIDDFIDHFSNDLDIEILGKIAICYCILHAEAKSSLLLREASEDINHEIMDRDDVWLKQLWYMMRDGVRVNRPADLFKNITFIIFNYDRTVEVFLYFALQKMFGLSQLDAIHWVNNAPIIHPYGLVSPIGGSPSDWGFGIDNSMAPLGRLSLNIRTYSESEQDPQVVGAIQQSLSDAVNVVFLGFAFHPQNMELLDISELDGTNVNVMGTAIGIHRDNWREIGSIIGSRLRATPALVNTSLQAVTGAELLRRYERHLIN